MEPSTRIAASLSTTPIASDVSLSSGFASASSPAELSDAELLTATRRLVGRSNQLLASLLAHLAEVEARGIHRTRACASLYTYCIYELRFSEDEAFRRVSAARLVHRFPELLEAIARWRAASDWLVDAGSAPHSRQSRRGHRAREAPHQEGNRAPGPAARSVAPRPATYRAPRASAIAARPSGANLEPIHGRTQPRPRAPARR